MHPKHYFVLPKNRDLRSGGNLYNEFFTNALIEAGATIEIIDFDQYIEFSARDKNGLFWVDTLYLNELKQSTLSLHNTYLIVHHLESLYPPNGNSKDWYNKHEQALLQQLNGFLTTSQFTTNYLRDNGIKQPVWTIPPALTSIVKPIFQEENTMKALLVANVIKRKGILSFLNCLLKQLPKSSEAEIRIVGGFTIEENYARACQQLVAETKLKDHVHFLGELNSKKVHQNYQWANLFISTAYMETYGMAIQEAVGHQLPLLITKGGNSANHVVKDTNGLSFNNHKELVGDFVDFIKDSSRFNAFRQKAWSFKPYETYTWKSAASNFLTNFTSHNS